VATLLPNNWSTTPMAAVVVMAMMDITNGDSSLEHDAMTRR
jgi:hypothetical protein